MTSHLTPTLNSRSASSAASALIKVEAPPPTLDARPLLSVVNGSGLLSVSESACHSVALERALTRLKNFRFFLWRWTSPAVWYLEDFGECRTGSVCAASLRAQSTLDLIVAAAWASPDENLVGDHEGTDARLLLHRRREERFQSLQDDALDRLFDSMLGCAVVAVAEWPGHRIDCRDVGVDHMSWFLLRRQCRGKMRLDL